MSATVLERDMLKTAVPERDMDVTTVVHAAHLAWRPQHPRPPWTAVWADPLRTRLVWLHFWEGPTTPGGLAEAHAHIVAQVQRGEIPAQSADEEG